MGPRTVAIANEPAMLASMDAVMCEAYDTTSFAHALRRFATVQPDGLAVVEVGGRVVGTGCCVAYADAGFGWIGLIATRPGHERRGIASAVTAHLVEVLSGHGCRAVLDASGAGGPMYERMGFADRGAAQVLRLPTGPLGPSPGIACAPFDATDLPAVAAYDAPRFGADRQRLLTVAWEQRSGRAFATRAPDGAITGYQLASDGVVGPLVADDVASLTTLVGTVSRLPWASPARLNVPADSGHLAALLDLGAEPMRSLRHMHLGIDRLPGRRRAVAGMLSLGEG